MNHKEDYLSYKDCLKLKHLGYNWASDGLWYLSATYNGEQLGLDEEYELRSEGITEFDYKPRTWLHYHKNEDCNNENECSLVDYYNAAHWLETVKNVKPFSYAVEMTFMKCQLLMTATHTVLKRNA